MSVQENSRRAVAHLVYDILIDTSSSRIHLECIGSRERGMFCEGSHRDA
jgi:hypothetical protein